MEMGSFNYPRRRREQTSITLEKKNPKKLKTVIQKACAEKREERMLLNVVKCALTRGAEWKASVEKVQLQHRAVLPASRRAFQLRWPSQSKRWINSVRPMIPLRFAVVAQLHALYQDGGPCALQGKGRWTECKRGKERKKWGKGEGQEQLRLAEKRGWMCSLFPVDLAYRSLIKMCSIIRKSCAHYHIRSR